MKPVHPRWRLSWRSCDTRVSEGLKSKGGGYKRESQKRETAGSTARLQGGKTVLNLQDVTREREGEEEGEEEEEEAKATYASTNCCGSSPPE